MKVQSDWSTIKKPRLVRPSSRFTNTSSPRYPILSAKSCRALKPFLSAFSPSSSSVGRRLCSVVTSVLLPLVVESPQGGVLGERRSEALELFWCHHLLGLVVVGDECLENDAFVDGFGG